MLFMTIMSCSKNEPTADPQKPTPPTPNPTQDQIIISGDKTTLLADGTDKITFTVKKNGDIDITNDVKIKVNGTEISGNTYTSSQEGSFKATASYNNLQSNELLFSAVKTSPSSLVVKPSKTTLVADGGDLIVLSCVNAKDNTDYSSKVVFYANNKEIKGNIFKTNTPAEYTITAKSGNEQISPVTVKAQTEFSATNKVFLELFTATWCHYCPFGIALIDKAAKNERIITLCNQSDDNLTVYPDNVTIKQFLKISGYPTPLIDRNSKQDIDARSSSVEDILKYIKPAANVGISIESISEKQTITVNINVAAPQNLSNRKCVAILAENKISAPQENSSNNQHNHVYRASANGNVWGENIEIKNGTPASKIYTFPVKSNYNVKNCEIIVLVTDNDNKVINAQRCDVDKSIGY